MQLRLWLTLQCPWRSLQATKQELAMDRSRAGGLLRGSVAECLMRLQRDLMRLQSRAIDRRNVPTRLLVPEVCLAGPIPPRPTSMPPRPTSMPSRAT